MNAVTRFFRLGATDADGRVAAFLRPRDHRGAERYLIASVSLGTIDRATRRLEAWWLESETARAATAMAGAWSREARSSRSHTIGIVLLVAVAAHVSLLLWQGRPPAFYWLLIPAMAAAAGVLLLLSARAAD